MSQTPLPHDHGQDMELNPERLPKTEAFKIREFDTSFLTS